MPSRRDVLLGVGSAGLAASAGCLGSDDVEPGTDDSYGWTTGGADLRNSRAIPDGVAPREAPTLEWRADLESVHATGEPIVTDETVLLTTGTDVVAFDRESGDRRWSIDPENDAYSYRGAPTVVDGTAYVPEVGTLTARDVETGDVEWSHDLEHVIGRGSLTVSDRGDDGHVFVAAGNVVSALDARSGDRLWEREVFGSARYGIAKYTDYLYVATSGGELSVIDMWGRPEWRRTLEAGIQSAPTVLTPDDRRGGWGVAVVSGDGSVVSFDAGGSREWRTELGGFGDDGLAIGHRTLLARSGSTLFALDPDDGGHRWRVDLGASSNNPPILVGDTVYVGGDRLRAIDIGGGIGVRSVRFGEQRFEYETAGSIGYVTATDGKLFLTTNVAWDADESAELIVLS